MPYGITSDDVCALGVVAPFDQRPPPFLGDAIHIEKLQPVIMRARCGLQHRGRLVYAAATPSRALARRFNATLVPLNPGGTSRTPVGRQRAVRRVRSNEDRRGVGAALCREDEIADERFAGPQENGVAWTRGVQRQLEIRICATAGTHRQSGRRQPPRCAEGHEARRTMRREQSADVAGTLRGHTHQDDTLWKLKSGGKHGCGHSRHGNCSATHG